MVIGELGEPESCDSDADPECFLKNYKYQITNQLRGKQTIPRPYQNCQMKLFI